MAIETGKRAVIRDSTWEQATIKSVTATLDFPSIAAGTGAELTVAVTGAVAGDLVTVAPPAALEAGLSATGYVSAADTVTIRLVNATVGAVDPASADWTVGVLALGGN